MIKVTENMNGLNLGVNSVQLPILAEEKNKIWGIEPTCLKSLRQFVAKLGLESWFPNSSSGTHGIPGPGGTVRSNQLVATSFVPELRK